VDIAGTLRDRLADSPLIRRATALLVLPLAAVWLSAKDLPPAALLAIAAVLALFLAPLIAPHRHRYIRKPKKELDITDGDSERNRGKTETPKRPYSPPHLIEVKRRRGHGHGCR
jgi:hypothetical protein